jgi:hypothetical protein
MLDLLGSSSSLCEYTQEDRDHHYSVLENGIKFYVENRPVTEDFLEESKDLIITYIANLPQLSKASPAIKDYRFRELMVESESILNHLRTEMKETGIINTKIFHDFCKKQKQCLDIIKKLDCGVDELTTMVTNLSVKTNRRKLRL